MTLITEYILMYSVFATAFLTHLLILSHYAIQPLPRQPKSQYRQTLPDTDSVAKKQLLLRERIATYGTGGTAAGRACTLHRVLHPAPAFACNRSPVALAAIARSV